MKNKIILAIFIILSISSCKSNHNPGGGGGGKKVTIKDNFEIPQTNTQAAKDFLVKFNEIKQKYPKAELMLYYRKSNSTSDSGYSRYYFDDNANITNIYINGQGNKKTNSIFWGMLPDNPQIACYYYKQNNGDYGTDHSLMYENGLIKNKSRIFNNSGHYEDKDIVDKSRNAMLKSTGTYISCDYTKLKPYQTDTKDANDWKNLVTNKTYEIANYFWASDKKAYYIFDSNGNLTFKYNSLTYKKETNEKYTFWGATNEGEYLYGLYHGELNSWKQYSGKDFYISSKASSSIQINEGNGNKSKFIFPSTTNNSFDYKTLNISTTTNENEIYRNNVKNKIIEKKEVMNTYTFLDNGDISVKTSEGKYYTLHFWGAESSEKGIYYVKVNLQDIFGNIAPNEETYFYYGYSFEESSSDRSLSELIEYWQHYRNYCGAFTNWYEKYFDGNGKPKDKIDWATMPLQTTNIWHWKEERILLMTNK